MDSPVLKRVRAIATVGLVWACSAPEEASVATTQTPFTNQYNFHRWTGCKSTDACPPLHEEITVRGLSFLKSEVKNYLASSNANFDASHVIRSPGVHFDDCYFQRASRRIRDAYEEAVDNALMFPALGPCQSYFGACFEYGNSIALDKFVEVLHATQDFYAHTNWIENGLLEVAFPADVPNNPAFPLLQPYATIRGLRIIDGEPPAGWVVSAPPPNSPYPRSMQVRVTGVTAGAPEPGLISGRSPTSAGVSSRCPEFAGVGTTRIDHDDLAKDRPPPNPASAPRRSVAFANAVSLAVEQTTEEWCRFQNLVYRKRHSPDDVKFLCEKWVQDPNAVNTACSMLPVEAQCPETSGGSGGSGGGGSSGGTGGCTPLPPSQACATGQDCDAADDGCGTQIICGVCTPPETCGGGGTPRQCGCTPMTPTQACAGKNCDSTLDGCGGLVDCGTCTLPQTCGGNSVPNQCGCTPLSPAQACVGGQNCGTALDACGGFVDCGSCTAPDTCAGGGTQGQCGHSGMTAVIRSHWNLPLNNPNPGDSLEPNVSDGSGGWYFNVHSSNSANSISTTVDMSNNTCQRSNAVIGGSIVELYILGPPGTPYSIDYDWTQSVTAASNGRGTPLQASTLYSSFGNISAYAEVGQSAAESSAGGEIVNGATSGPTIDRGSLTYSRALSFNLAGGAGTNGNCFVCSEQYCECGSSRATITLNATLL